jgi:hypothetical protein
MAQSKRPRRRAILRLWTLAVWLVPTTFLTGRSIAPRYGTDEHRLTVAGAEAGVATYEVTVSDTIAAIDDAGPLAVGPSVEGAIDGGVHEYRFAGEVTNVRVSSGEVTPRIYVDGRPVAAGAR